MKRSNRFWLTGAVLIALAAIAACSGRQVYDSSWIGFDWSWHLGAATSTPMPTNTPAPIATQQLSYSIINNGCVGELNVGQVGGQNQGDQNIGWLTGPTSAASATPAPTATPTVTASPTPTITASPTQVVTNTPGPSISQPKTTPLPRWTATPICTPTPVCDCSNPE